VKGALPRGVDVDLNGIVWTSLAQTSQLAARPAQCTGAMTGEKALAGQHCSEAGRSIHSRSNFKGLEERNTTEWSYNWVDR
jgi:hypothetical protein